MTESDSASLVELPPDHPDLPIKPPVIFLMATLFGYLVHWFSPVSVRPDAWAGLGAIFLAMGLGLCAWAWFTLKAHHTDVRPWKPTTAIVTSGPYAYTRNPIYLGFALVQLGVGLWTDRLAVVLLAIPAVVITNNVVIAREETYLARKFGEPYERYLHAVRRWI